MRGILSFSPAGLITFFFIICLIYVQGCTRTLLQTYPATDSETEVVLETFSRFQKKNARLCSCCLDAEADASISVSGWFRDHNAEFSGYLQAMKPAYFRFVAVNPFGQPWYILVTDGKFFTSLNVFAEKAYSGSVDSEIFQTFIPPGIDPKSLYSWLTGRPEPNDMSVKQVVLRDRDRDGYWLRIDKDNEELEELVLFDPIKMLILRRIVRDGKHRHLVDLQYESYQSVSAALPAGIVPEEQCLVSGRISLTTHDGAEKLVVSLHSFLDGAHFSPDDFQLKIPDNIEQVQVR